MDPSKSQIALEAVYEDDFFAWTQDQADLLKTRRFNEIDVANLVEEIESLGRAQINALRSRYTVLCAHLLKYMLQPERRSRSWTLTIIEQRVQIARLLADSPSLKGKRGRLFREGYEDGVKFAAAETGAATIPSQAPFTVDQAEDEGWLP